MIIFVWNGESVLDVFLDNSTISLAGLFSISFILGAVRYMATSVGFGYPNTISWLPSGMNEPVFRAFTFILAFREALSTPT